MRRARRTDESRRLAFAPFRGTMQRAAWNGNQHHPQFPVDCRELSLTKRSWRVDTCRCSGPGLRGTIDATRAPLREAANAWPTTSVRSVPPTFQIRGLLHLPFRISDSPIDENAALSAFRR